MNDDSSALLASFSERRRRLFEELRERPSGLEWCARHTRLADVLLGVLYDEAIAAQTKPPVLAVVATGGYGRRELAPHSDIDLTIVPLDESDPSLDLTVRSLFRAIQHAFDRELKMAVGYTYRLVADAPGLDPHTRSALLDARLVAGDNAAFDALLRAYWESFPVADFLIDKIAERRVMTAKYNDTPYAVEPHLKEGAGGMRAFQCANWLRAAMGERMARPTAAYDEVAKVRNLLHLVSGKTQDILNRVRAAEVAELLGVDASAMGSTLAGALAALDDEYQVALEKLHEARFPLGPGAMAVRGEIRIGSGVRASEAALGVALATKLDLRVTEFQATPSADVGGPEALTALASGEATIRNMERCGVLQVLLPELTACKTLLPDDQWHAYSVYEHTLRLVRYLDSLEPGSFLGGLLQGLHDPAPLYLAALLHDVGKAHPERDHSELGEETARAVATRWRLPNATTELVAWLVKEHLSLARILRMRDVQHLDTAAELATLVGTPERLAMLTLLTWADVSAVAPEAWTPMQDVFLKELHARAAAALSEDEEGAPDPLIYRRRILRRLKREQTPEAELERFVDSLPAHYVLGTPPEQVRAHFEFAKQAERGEPIVELYEQPELGATEVTVCCADAAGLLSRLLGVFYALDLSLVGIRASTTSGPKPVAIDVFTVMFGNRPLSQALARRLTTALHQVLKGERSVDDLLRQNGKDPTREQEVYRYTFIEGDPGIIEIRAPRGRGMAYRISRIISAHGWNIVAARVGQWAASGAAAFYVEGPSRTKLGREDVELAFGATKVS